MRTLYIILLLWLPEALAAQNISNTLYDDAFITGKTIDPGKAVGAIDGGAGVTLSGAATYHIPIQCPFGTHGMQPQLSVDYNSQIGVGLLGRGWHLSGLSVISRVGKTIYQDGKTTPVSFAGNDALSLDGNRLILISGTYGASGSIYRLEMDNFSTVTLMGNGAGQWFRVLTKGGTTMDYGSTSDARFLNDNGTAVALWHLNRVEDVNGNFMLYEYIRWTTGIGPLGITNMRTILLDKIRYTGNSNTALAPYNEIKLHYIPMPHPTVMYEGGSSLVQNTLVGSISITGEGSQLFKAYLFNYGDNRVSTMLQEVVEYDNVGAALNSTVFKYGDTPPDLTVEPTNINGLGNNTHVFCGDFNGDGVPEMVSVDQAVGPGNYSYMSGFSIYAKNGVGNNYAPEYSVSVNAGNTVSYKKQEALSHSVGIRKTDFNGDGLEDIFTFETSYGVSNHWHYIDSFRIYYGNRTHYLDTTTTSVIPISSWNGQNLTFHTEPQDHESFFIGDFDGDKRSDVFVFACDNGFSGDHYGFIFESGVTQRDVIGINNHPFNTHEFKAEVIDFDGDGKNEILFTGNLNYYVYSFEKQSNGSYNAILLSSGSNGFPSSWYTLYPGDFNGDGKTDLLGQAGDGSHWKIAYATGTSFTTNTFTFSHLPSRGFTPDKILLADYNGDDRTDIAQIYKDPAATNMDYLSVYFSTGTSFDEFSAHNTNTINLFGMLTASDINGDGKADIVSKKSIYDQPVFLFLKKDGRELLLDKVKDGLGRTFAFAYRRMAEGGTFYNQGPTAGAYPLNYLSGGIYLVSSLSMPDGNGGQWLTTYGYERAVAHLGGRGFLGFRKVITTNQAQDIRTESLFDIHPTYYAAWKTEDNTYLASTGQPLTHATYNIGFQNTVGQCFYQQLHSSTEQNLLSGASATTSNLYDNRGNVTQNTINVSGVENTVATTIFTTTANGLDRPSSISVVKTRGGSTHTDQTNFQYDPTGRLISRKEFANQPLYQISTYSYDAFGNVLSETLGGVQIPYSATTQTQYDSKGRFPVAVTNALGQTVYTTWHPLWGKPVSTTGIDGITTTATYNSWGRQTGTTVGATFMQPAYTIGYAKEWELNNGGVWHTKITHPGRPDIKTIYDLMGRAIRTETDHFGGQKRYESASYNAKGQLVNATLPHLLSEPAQTITYAYDAYGRTNSMTDIHGTLSYSYGFSNGKTTTTVTGPSGTTTSTIDAAGRLIEETDNGGTLCYEYTGRGDLASVRQGILTLQSHTYNSYGQRTATTDCDAGNLSYTYDAWGRMTSQRDAKPQTTGYSYDVANRLTSRTGAEGTTTYEYFDETGYGSINKLKKITAFSGITDEYSYDARGNTSYTKRTIGNKIFESGYNYNAYGDLRDVNHSSGFFYSNEYDTDGFLTRVSTNWTGQNVTLFSATAINGNGQYTAWQYGNGKTTTKTYQNDWLASKYTPGIQNLSTDFDLSTGNLLSRTNHLSSLREDFTYDNLNRLTTATVSNFGPFPYTAAPQTVVYDKSGIISQGNIRNKSDVGAYSYGSFPRHATQGVSNLQPTVSVLQQDISYTPFHMTEKVTENGWEQAFTYDAEYRRAKTVLSQNSIMQQTRYYLDGYEYNDVGNFYTYYIPGGDGLCAIVEHGASFYAPVKKIHYAYTDHLGSILTVTDETGNVEAQQSFDAWGRTRSPKDWSYASTPPPPAWLSRGYTGHEQMPAFTLINMNGRIYDPLLGRMLSPDPYVAGGTQGHNRYSYCLNNPLKYTDPTGEIVWAPIIIGAVVGAYMGGAMANNSYNPGEWNYNSGRTWSYMASGAVVGGVSGGLGAYVAGSGGIMANTAGIMAGSYVNSLGTAIYTGGQTDVSMSMGAASYDFSNGSFGYLGKKGNSTVENVGYGFGAMANVSDVLAGFNPGSVVLRTENDPNYYKTLDANGNPIPQKDLIGHSQITDMNGKPLVDWGPAPGHGVDGLGDWVPGTNSFEQGLAIPASKMKWNPLTINGLNVSRISSWNPSGNYNLALNSCVSQTSRALNASGVFNIGVHPYLLHAQMYLRSIGVRPMLYSYYPIR
ncbi:MAG: VCBS repeat-containing protein [Bacteroidetes bacterium]|nr:VCBS repeat-containing protein [Bacteroidota bacterium]